MNRTLAFLIYSLTFEILIWGLAAWAALNGHGWAWLLLAAIICGANDHLKLSTWTNG